VSKTLTRRLDALEAPMRPFRELAEERGVPIETLLRHYRECRARTAELRARGLTDEHILEATAERIGCTPDALRAERDALMARFG
jgi:hypothetical protein